MFEVPSACPVHMYTMLAMQHSGDRRHAALVVDMGFFFWGGGGYKPLTKCILGNTED